MTYHIENFGYAYTPIHMHAQKDILAHMSPVVDFNELHMKSFWRHDVCHLGIYLQMLILNFKIMQHVGCFFLFLFFTGKECGALMDLIMGICLVTAITA